MAAEKSEDSVNSYDEADLAKALQELAKGERTATALENQLTAVEAKIEALIAQAESNHAEAQKMKDERAGVAAPNGDPSLSNGEQQQHDTKRET